MTKVVEINKENLKKCPELSIFIDKPSVEDMKKIIDRDPKNLPEIIRSWEKVPMEVQKYIAVNSPINVINIKNLSNKMLMLALDNDEDIIDLIDINNYPIQVQKKIISIHPNELHKIYSPSKALQLEYVKAGGEICLMTSIHNDVLDYILKNADELNITPDLPNIVFFSANNLVKLIKYSPILYSDIYYNIFDDGPVFSNSDLKKIIKATMAMKEDIDEDRVYAIIEQIMSSYPDREWIYKFSADIDANILNYIDLPENINEIFSENDWNRYVSKHPSLSELYIYIYSPISTKVLKSAIRSDHSIFSERYFNECYYDEYISDDQCDELKKYYKKIIKKG